MTRFVDKVGVELEGFYTNEDYSRISYAVEHTDNSFRTTKPGFRNREFIPERPFTLAGGEEIEGKLRLKNWIKQNYPSLVNYQCGFHVHISLQNPEHYRLLMTEEFYNFYLEKYALWGKINKVPKNALFWKRLEGKVLGKNRNRMNFAKRLFSSKNVADQIHGRGDRYCHLNFAYSKYRTMESRMLPMFKTPELAYLAVLELVRIIEQYLFTCMNTETPASYRELREVIELPEMPEVEVEVEWELV